MRYLSIVCFVAASLFVASSTAVAAPLSYSWVGAEYGIDSSVQIEGGDYDSDDTFGVRGEYEVAGPWFLSAGTEQGGYDLRQNEDYSIGTTNAGLGWHTSLLSRGDYNVDAFAVLSWEYLDSYSKTFDGNRHPVNGNGAGVKAGVRAAISPNLELHADLYEVSYGQRFLERKGGVDGLRFEVGAALALADHVDLTLNYLTGEFDYNNLPTRDSDVNVEVDRDEVLLGVRYCF